MKAYRAAVWQPLRFFFLVALSLFSFFSPKTQSFEIVDALVEK
jgi:hypothetical protein